MADSLYSKDPEIERRDKYIGELLEQNKALKDALVFYADPSTYHGVGFLIDKPTGGFDEDFSDVSRIMPEYPDPKPGKRAREFLAWEGPKAK